jgi:hypothetical protein
MSKSTVYDPQRHSPQSRLRFAVAAVVNSAKRFVDDATQENFNQLRVDVTERDEAWKADDISKWEVPNDY